MVSPGLPWYIQGEIRWRSSDVDDIGSGGAGDTLAGYILGNGRSAEGVPCPIYVLGMPGFDRMRR